MRRTEDPNASGDPRTGRRTGQAARGFSLTELLIVIAIIGIIAAFALPNFTRQLQSSRRTDAMDALLRVAAEQEKFFINNNTYTDNLSALGFTPATSANGFYSLSLVADTETFQVTATPVSSGPQAEDKRCAEFTLNHQQLRGAKDSDGGEAAADCWR